MAALVGLWLVLGGMLGARHEAQFGHVLDPHTGQIRHAEAVVGAHWDAKQPAYHRTDTRSDGEVCGIATALHQAARANTSSASIIEPELQLERDVAGAYGATVASATVYRFAPKTSPPLVG